MFKRILLRYWCQIRWDNPFALRNPQICLNLLAIAVIACNSCYLLLQLFLRHPLKNFLFLLYPSVILLVHLSFRNSSFLLLSLFSAFSRLVVYFALFGVGGSAPPAKFNTMGWFTYRFKHLAYSSFECSYFAGFLPLRFLQVKQLSRLGSPSLNGIHTPFLTFLNYSTTTSISTTFGVA